MRIHIKLPVLILALVSQGLVSCSSHVRNADIGNHGDLMASTEGGHCVLVPENLSRSRIPADLVAREATLFNDPATELVTVRRVLAVSGACVESIVGYQVDSAYLSDGRILAIEPDIGFPKDGRSYVAPTLTTVPDGFGGEGFVMAHRVTDIAVGDESAEVLVGLWNSSTGADIKVFRRHADGRLDGVRKLLNFPYPVDSLRYFPGPDTPGGTLTLTAKDGPSSMKLISIDWSHPGLASAFD